MVTEAPEQNRPSLQWTGEATAWQADCKRAQVPQHSAAAHVETR
jgi:hypothetical protein